MMPTETDPADAGSSPDGDNAEDTRRSRVDRRNQQLSSELRELKAELAKYRDAEAERAAEDERLREEKEREAGEWAKLKDRYEVKLKEAYGERDQVLEQLKAKDRADREAKLLDSIVELSGVEASRTRLKGLLRIAAEEHGLDTAPEELTKDIVKHAHGVLKGLDRDTFEPRRPGGGTPGTVGTPQTGGKLGEIRERVAREGWTPELKAEYAAEMHKAPP